MKYQNEKYNQAEWIHVIEWSFSTAFLAIMNSSPDYITEQIKSILFPESKKDGFQLFKSKTLVRINGISVDHIWLNLWFIKV